MSAPDRLPVAVPGAAAATGQPQDGLARPRLFASDGWVALGLFLSAFAVRVFHLGELWYWVEDSIIHVPTASAYTLHGVMGPDDWWTQPLKHVLRYAGIALFGNDVIGWRMPNVLFGAGVVAMTYLVARAVVRRPLPAVCAAVLVALDPLSVAWSRNTSEDTPATFFILLACLFLLRSLASDRDRDRDRVLGGLSLGVAVALRWYAVIPALVIVGATVYRQRRSGAAALLRSFSYLVLLPASVYVTSFLPWARRGHSLAEWMSLNAASFRVQASGLEGVHDNIAAIAGPLRWFTGWVGASVRSYRPGAFTVMFNDLPVWLLFVPAVAYLAYRGYRGRSAPALVVAGSFALLYAFFLSAQRPIMLYSAIPVVPFGAIALGFAADRLLGRRAWVFVAAAIAWSAYLYPLASGIPVSASGYAWLLSRMAGG